MRIVYNYQDKSEKKYLTFPDELLNEDYAIRIHSQTLKRLNERGGLAPTEIILNVKKLPFNSIYTLDNEECKAEIYQMIEAHDASPNH